MGFIALILIGIVIYVGAGTIFDILFSLFFGGKKKWNIKNLKSDYMKIGTTFVMNMKNPWQKIELCQKALLI